MALADQDQKQQQQKTDKKPPPIEHQRNDKKEKQYTKVMIRRLPPTMDQETFLNQISPVPNYDYFYMVKGDGSLGENSFSRAYINFTNQQDIYDFKEKFDNYVFLDNAGHEYTAVVEYAPFQKIPKRRHHQQQQQQQQKRTDPKCNTIEQDSYYLEFLDMVNKLSENDGVSGEKLEYSYPINDNKNDEPTTTPLLEFLKKKHHERMRIREERREERKRREFERKKYRDEEHQPLQQRNSSKKRYDDEKSPNKIKHNEHNDDDNNNNNNKTENEQQQKFEETTNNEKYERTTTAVFYKSRDKKYEKYDDKKRDIKNRYPKKDYIDKREYKSSNRRDDYNRDYNRPKYDDHNKNKDDFKSQQQQQQQKKVKKYSEKREERKIEALKKLEQSKQEQSNSSETAKTSNEDVDRKPTTSNEIKEQKKIDQNLDKNDKEPKAINKNKDTNDLQSQKRIRNKDRPSIALYRPGMLSKRKQVDPDTDNKDNKKE